MGVGARAGARARVGDIRSSQTAGKSPLAKQKDCGHKRAVPVMHSRSTAQKRTAHRAQYRWRAQRAAHPATQVCADRLSSKTRWWGGLLRIHGLHVGAKPAGLLELECPGTCKHGVADHDREGEQRRRRKDARGDLRCLVGMIRRHSAGSRKRKC